MDGECRVFFFRHGDQRACAVEFGVGHLFEPVQHRVARGRAVATRGIRADGRHCERRDR